MEYNYLVDCLQEDIQPMNEMAGIKSIVIVSTEGIPPDGVTKAKFVVHSNTGRIYKYEAEASPYLFQQFINEVNKRKYGTAINTISPYIVNYKDTLGELDESVNEGMGKAIAGAAVAGSLLFGTPQPAQAKPPVHVTQKEQKIDLEKLLHAIKQVESSGGIDKRDRYEARIERLIRNRWNKISPYLRQAVQQYGFRRMSSSYGPYQIIASTAYEMGYRGIPEDLRNENVSKPYVIKYLNQIIKSNKTSDVEDVISAYNAGIGGVGINPGYVRKVLKFYKVNENVEDAELVKVWSDYKVGKVSNAGKNLLDYLRSHPQTAKDIAERSRDIVKNYEYLYRVGDSAGLSWTPDIQVLKRYFPEEYNSGEIYKIKVDSYVLEDVIGHEDVFPYISFTKYLPETEVLLKLENQVDYEYVPLDEESYEVNETMTIQKAIEDIQSLIDVQSSDPIVQKGDEEGEYMRGLANGMIVAKACVDEKEPKFLNPDGKLEESISGYDYSSTQLEIPKEFAQDILNFVLSIPEKELYTERKEGELVYGREMHPHITIKYGLETNDGEEVKELVKDTKPFGIVLGKLSIFSKDDKPYDVVKVDIEGAEELKKLNKLLSTLPNKDENPEYIPHLTIAYVKKGEGDKYIGREDLKGIEIKFDSFMFKGKEGQDLKIELASPSQK